MYIHMNTINLLFTRAVRVVLSKDLIRDWNKSK